MTGDDAKDAVIGWLTGQPIAFLTPAAVVEVEPQHFKVGILQLAPESKRRVFEIAPLEIADCYEVREVAA